ncbi:MAG: iron ABC transporter permease [Spirochaetaceae bacterium]
MNKNIRFLTIISILIVTLLVFSFIVLFMGINFENQKVAAIIFGIRKKQLLGAISIGGGLAIAGTVLQTYFNNSLASPHTLGIISLSGVGAALSIVFGLSTVYQFGFALGGALLLFILISYSKMKHSNIIFIGIFLNFVGDSLIMWIKYLFAKIEDYASIDYWFWGSLEKITSKSQWWLLILIIPILVIIFKSSNFLDLISQGIEHQKNISFDRKRFNIHERVLILMTAIIVAISTITTGKIGFIGLMAPHIAKKIGYGFEHKKLLIISLLVGANILTISLFLQILLKNIELGKFPIGLLLSIPGIITFFYILRGNNR